MLDHHIQRKIVYRLAFSEAQRFAELKPDTLENKLFDYHLKKVIAAKLVAKQADGRYALTPEGRRLGRRLLDRQLALADKAESVVFFAVRRASDKAWLLYRRKVHPLLGRVGFMHMTPTPEEEVLVQATNVCRMQTGISATFRVLGSGFFRAYDGDQLESFTNFTFLVSDEASGKLKTNSEFAEFFWVEDPNFSDDDMLPNMKTLGNLHKANELFFIEKSFHL